MNHKGSGLLDVRSSIGLQGGEHVRQFIKKLRISHWLILFYPVFMFFIQRQREFQDIYKIDISAIYQIGYTAASAIYVSIRFLKYPSAFKRLFFHTPNRWFLLYCCVAVVSSVWSHRPDYTLFRAVQIMIFFVLIVDAMYSLGSLDEMIKLQLLFALILILFWHLGALRFEMSFRILHNSLVSGATLALAFIGWTVRDFAWRSIYMLVIFSIIIATSSATYLGILFGIGVLLLFKKGKVRILAIFMIICIILLTAMYGINIFDIVFWGKSEQNIMTASGRIPAWKWALDKVLAHRPVLGYSFGEGEAITRIHEYGYVGFRLIHMHNIAVTALTNLGIVGLTVIAIFLADILRSILKLRRHYWSPFAMGAFFALLLNALSINSVTASLSLPWICHMMFLTMIGNVYFSEKRKNTVLRNAV